jgi:geranylgeranyl reductase family protein
MRCDVAVIGAGPSGSWSAYRLAQRGARVLLFDPSHPREKPCGGGVTGRALDIVRSAVDVGALPTVTIDSARFTASSAAGAVDVPLPGRALIVAGRTEFDSFLLDAATRAGATWVRRRVSDVRMTPSGFEIDTRGDVYHADFLIGGDGANSLVRRRLSRPFRIDQLSIATGFFVQGATSHRIDIELTGLPPGYLWSFPRPSHLAIGICAQADAGVRASELRRTVARWIERRGVGGSTRLEPYSWPIPSLSAADFLRLEPSAGRHYLVGDAAGLVDPITREGIYFALLSGQWAAESIASGDADASRTYCSRVRGQISGELARAARLKTTFFRPEFARLLIDALRSSPAVAGVMADLVAGTQGYRGLGWRLARTCEFGLAARLLVSGLDSRRERERVRSTA